MPTSSATSTMTIQYSQPGAMLVATTVVATPTHRAAAAKNDREKSSSVRRAGLVRMGGNTQPQAKSRKLPGIRSLRLSTCGFSSSLLTLRLAFFAGRCQGRRPNVDRAGLGRVDVLDVGRPAVRGRGDRWRGVARRLGEGDTTRTDRRRVLDGVGEVRLFRRHQVAQVGLHRGEIRLFLRVGKLRDRDRGQNADDHNHDEQLNQRKTLAVHLYIPLCLSVFANTTT